MTLHQTQCIGEATPAEQVPAVPSELSKGASRQTVSEELLVQIAKVDIDSPTDTLPAHLEDLYSRSVANLAPEQKLPVPLHENMRLMKFP